MKRTLPILACLALGGCASILPSSQRQATEQVTKLDNRITNAIGEVGELRNTVVSESKNVSKQVQNEIWPWVVGLGLVCIVGAAFPCLLLILVAWLVRRWLAAQTIELRNGKA